MISRATYALITFQLQIGHCAVHGSVLVCDLRSRQVVAVKLVKVYFAIVEKHCFRNPWAMIGNTNLCLL